MQNNYTALTQDDITRYSQQIKLHDIGQAGQLKLKNARVLCIGIGGLGSPLLMYLASAGVGTLVIIDDDTVELDNLQRQILYRSHDIGQAKALIAKQQLNSLNPNIHIDLHTERFNAENARNLIIQYDIIADCSDNFATHYLINDICFHLNKPFVTASVSQYEGHCTVFLGNDGPCYRCLFPQTTDNHLMSNCNEEGILGVLPGLLGIIQATEILKFILQLGNVLAGRLLRINALKMQFREFTLQRDPHCTCCAQQQPINTRQESNQHSYQKNTISAQELSTLLQQKNDLLLLDVRTPHEYEIENLGGKLIPLAELPFRLTELNPQQPTIVYCHAGQRSLAALKILTEANFKSVKHLEGGMLAWQQESGEMN